MKRLKSILLLAFVSFALISCEDDDDNSRNNGGTGNGSFEYAGTTYPLEQGILSNYGADIDPNLYNFDIALYSNDFNFNFVDQTATGVGEYVDIELWSDQESGLKNGTYTFQNGAPTDLSFTYAFISTDFNIQTGDGNIEDDANGGTVVLSINNNRVDISFTLTTDLGETVTGSYSGDLRPFDAR